MMMIALAEDMARSTTDLSDELPVLFFGLELPDTIVNKRTDAFADFDFTLLFIHVGT